MFMGTNGDSRLSNQFTQTHSHATKPKNGSALTGEGRKAGATVRVAVKDKLYAENMGGQMLRRGKQG